MEFASNTMNFAIKIDIELGVGSTYETIKEVIPMNGGDPVDLIHH